MAANRLKNILKMSRTTEVSLVGEGDNPGADVLVLKMRDAVHIPSDTAMDQFGDFAEAVASLYELAAGQQGDEGVEKASAILKGLGMTIEELQAKLDDVEATVESITKERDTLKEQNDKLVSERDAAVTERDEAVAKAKAADGKGGDGASDEDVYKDLPEPVRKRLEKADKDAAEARDEVAKLREEKDVEGFVAKAKGLGVKDEKAIGELLHRVAKGKSTAEDADKVVEVLTIAKNVGEEGNALFEAIGKANGTDADEGAAAQAKLDEKIAKLRGVDTSLTYEQAYDRVLTDPANAALYEEVKKIRPTAKAA
jgi:chromosome segregation ATPase